MDKFFKNLEPKMSITPPQGFDVNPCLKAFENSIDIYNSFNMLQTVDLPPQPPMSPKEASITTTPSTTTALATTASVVPATLPKRPVTVMHTTPRVMHPRAWQIKAMQLAQMEQAFGLRGASIELWTCRPFRPLCFPNQTGTWKARALNILPYSGINNQTTPGQLFHRTIQWLFI